SSLGKRNGAYPVSLEHKMGIMASPTCVMAYGEKEDCVGYLLGEENKGMSAMFTMMNNARLSIGVQGIGCSERAYQMALDYAKERVQGKSVKTGNKKAPIIEHPDVRRMLMTIKASTEGARALTYLNAKAIDLGRCHPDADTAEKYKGLADLLTPLSKAYGTDLGFENASLAMQVFGGMGYMEETGIAQIVRDARINPIYEGTNGIQAMDLVGRKLAMNNGKHWQSLMAEMIDFAEILPKSDEFNIIRKNLIKATEHSKECALWLAQQYKENMSNSLAGSVPFLRLLSTAICCYLMAKGAHAAKTRLEGGDPDKGFLQSKIITARFYAEQIVPTVLSLKSAITSGDELFFAINAENMS
ncbi:MAG: acyl-CoA dehydrogenase, partial [Kordiimonadaceae bacterium]|nr:acyl-CoA dehydrogenase [Kordiimonadaceae bacterium]